MRQSSDDGRGLSVVVIFFFYVRMYGCTGFVSNSISIHPDGMHARVKRLRLNHHPMAAYSCSSSQYRPSQHITTTTEDSRNAAFGFEDFSSYFGEKERQVRLRKEIKKIFPGREGGWGGTSRTCYRIWTRKLRG